jgi:D-alanyl-D-alanine dipeptidase
VKKPNPPAEKVPFSRSLQAIVVTTDGWAAIQGKARLFERTSPAGNWRRIGKEIPVVVGRNGLAWDADSAPEGSLQHKQEGDGKSPGGLFPLTFSFGTSAKPEGLSLPYKKLERFTECVDDARSSHYNTVVDRMKVGNNDWKSSEKMLDVGEQYGLGVFVAYNSYPVTAGSGSCIFLHIWKDAATGTSGCTAMDRRDLERIVGWLEPSKNPYLIQLPQEAYNKYRKSWNLPKF